MQYLTGVKDSDQPYWFITSAKIDFWSTWLFWTEWQSLFMYWRQMHFNHTCRSQSKEVTLYKECNSLNAPDQFLTSLSWYPCSFGMKKLLLDLLHEYLDKVRRPCFQRIESTSDSKTLVCSLPRRFIWSSGRLSIFCIWDILQAFSRMRCSLGVCRHKMGRKYVQHKMWTQFCHFCRK